MAQAFSNVKQFSLLISNTIVRRGFAAGASQGKAGVVRGGTSTVKHAAEKTAGTREKPSWSPDPKTGYYRPDDGAKDVDPVELRALLLNDKR